MMRLPRKLASLSVVFAMLTAAALPAIAVQPDEILPDTAMEARARSISSGLRCLVCQNQSIDDSDAPLAKDLRILVRERLKAGDSDGQVREFLVARYGEFVLLKPPVQWSTIILWAAPFVILLAALAFVWRSFAGARARTAAAGPAADLTADERAALDKLLAGQPANRK